MIKNKLIEIVDCIMEAADELRAKEDRDLVEQGELIAYAETLTIIQDAFAGDDLAEIGLDFDVDKKYLY